MKPTFYIDFWFAKPKEQDANKWRIKIDSMLEWFEPVAHIVWNNIAVTQEKPPVSEYKPGAWGIEPKYYDKEFTKPALHNKQSNMILVTVPTNTWKGKTRGWRTFSHGLHEMTVMANYRTRARSKKDKGTMKDPSWENIARHEIMHALFKVAKQKDLTHHYWKQGKLEQARDSLDLTPKKVSYYNKVLAIFKALINRITW